MTDATTKKALHVSTESPAWPYIEVPFLQLEDLRQLLQLRGVGFSVEEDIISLNGGPQIAVVNLGRGADAAAVQAILDSVQ